MGAGLRRARGHQDRHRRHTGRAASAPTEGLLDAYRALRVRDYGRVDLRVADTGDIYVLEINASCYLGKEDEFAMAAAKAGIDYPDLVQRIVDLAMARYDGQRRS